MTDFNVGDKIKALFSSWCDSVTAGNIYTIIEVDHQKTWLRFVDDDNNVNGWGAENFELVETPQDTVVVTEDEFVAAVAAIDTATETVVAYLDSLNKRLEPYGISLRLDPHD